MSDTGNLTSPSEEKAPSVQGEPTAPLLVAEGAAEPVQAGQEQSASQQAQTAGLEFKRLQLLSRFLIGILTLGGQELMQHLRTLQQEIEAYPELLGEIAPDDETAFDLFRYLSIGLFRRGQIRIARGVRRGFQLSMNTTGWALRQANRLTNNWLTRSLRRPLESHLQHLEQETDLIINEGRMEEQYARWLAGQTINDIIDQVMDALSENPKLAELISTQLGQQSASLASVVSDNVRQVSVVADNFSEGIIRRLLRRKPRRELPPSPLAGKPQTMYLPETAVQRMENHDQ